MVVCTFSPEIYLLTASVTVPSHLLKKVFDRIREKQFQLVVNNTRSNGQSFSSELKSNLANSEKVRKTKRFSLRRQELHLLVAKQSHLRDSRMLAEDSRAKWLKQNDQLKEDNDGKLTDKGVPVMNTLVMMGSVLIMCAIGILCFVVAVKNHSNKAIHKQTEKNKMLKSCQKLPTAGMTNNKHTNIVSL